MLSRCSVRRTSIRHVATSIDDLCQGGHFERALQILSALDSPSLSLPSYFSLLKACNKSKNPAHTHLIHAHLALHRLHLTETLGNPLVVTLTKCGALKDAINVLHSLAHRTVISWTAIISTYAECGHEYEALRIYSDMLEDGIQPDLHTFVSLFKVYGNIHNLEEGMKMHAEAQKRGYTDNAFVGSSLVTMYGKCKRVAEAENVFVGVSEHDMVLWSSMLSLHVDMGLGERALLLYRQMQEECPSEERILFVLAIQACSALEGDKAQEKAVNAMAFDIGEAIHADIRARGLMSDVFICSALVSMYGKCGTIEHAEAVFTGLLGRDIGCWNSMLSTYVEQGCAVAALWAFRQLHEEGMSANRVTFTHALKACALFAENEEVSHGEGKPIKPVSLLLTQALHYDTEKEKTSDVFVDSALSSLYGKFGRIEDAENIFRGRKQPDSLSWTAMMSAYLEQGRGDKALRLFRQMYNDGVILDQPLYVLAIQACLILYDTTETSHARVAAMVLEIGQALQAEVRKRGFSSSAYICSTLISMYRKLGLAAKAASVFTGLSVHNLVTWMALLSLYVEKGEEVKAFQLYCEMLRDGISPDGPMLILALQACISLVEREVDCLFEGQTARSVSLQIGKALHADAKELGLTLDIAVCGTLVNFYGKCGMIGDAEGVFNALPQHNRVLHGTMLSVYVEQGLSDRALMFFKQMQRDEVTLDEASMVCILKACSDRGSLEFCNQMHYAIVCNGIDSSLVPMNTLIHAYGSCASMMDGQGVADGLTQPDMVSWSLCVAGYAHVGSYAMCLQAFVSMQLGGYELDGMTSLELLTLCSHMGLIEEGFDYFEFIKGYGLSPSKRHSLALADLLGRAGDFRRLEDFAARGPIVDDGSMWVILLSACDKHGHVELGEHAFNHVVDLQPERSSAYILMKNIYAETRSD